MTTKFTQTVIEESRISKSIVSIQAIDAHAHYGPNIGHNKLVDEFLSEGVDVVVQPAKQANTVWTIA